MPELTAVEAPKNAGFVDRGYNHARKKQRMEEEEKEIARLEAEARGETIEEEPDGEGSDATEVQAEGDTQQEEANTEVEAQEEDESSLSAEEKSFKKRYGDLRRHMSQKEKEWEEKFSALETRMTGEGIRPPKSDEDIEEWASQYPDVAGIVETIAAKKAQEMFSKAETKLKDLEDAKYEAERVKAENAIRKSHSDFDDLRASDDFHDWAEKQPKWVREALYENMDDPASVVRVIDLYKIDNNMTTTAKKEAKKAAASAVGKGSKTKLDADSTSGTIRESEVAKMSAQEFEDRSDEINQALRSGKFIYDLSGSAR